MLKTVGNPASRTGDQTIVNGNLVIGTSGNGIDFSADPSAAGMTSELLDDYEEGTWTPTDASGAGLTFSTAEGRYTRVGRLVTAHLYVVYPATAEASAAKIGGLPFAITASIGAIGGAWGYTNGSGAAQLAIDPGATEIKVYDNAGAARTNTNMSLTYNIVTFSYIA
jgi:hypothetical protein